MEKNKIQCLNCKKVIVKNNTNKFCSLSCAATNNNLKRQYKNTCIKESECLNCKNKFTYDKNKSTGKYCNNKCQGQYTFLNKTVKKVEIGEVRSSETIKKVLEFKYGYKCSICSIYKWQEKKLVLHLDHIDGNSDNNKIINLRLLCPNCHSQTETYCARNIKNTKRSEYKKRYRITKLGLST